MLGLLKNDLTEFMENSDPFQIIMNTDFDQIYQSLLINHLIWTIWTPTPDQNMIIILKKLSNSKQMTKHVQTPD